MIEVETIRIRRDKIEVVVELKSPFGDWREVFRQNFRTDFGGTFEALEVWRNGTPVMPPEEKP